MARQEPSASDAEIYLQQVQERQEMRDKAAGVQSDGDLPPVLDVAADGQEAVSVVSQDTSVPHHELFSALLEAGVPEGSLVEVVETVGRHIVARVLDGV